MGLRDVATADARAILTDAENGFGWPVTVTDPMGNTASLVGFVSDVGVTLEPETGELISGRQASVALPIADLYAAGFASLPVHIPEASARPWLVEFEHADHVEIGTYAVIDTRPDRTLNQVVCILEAYDSAPPAEVP